MIPSKHSRPRAAIALPSILAGLLLALSLPPFGFWPLAFIGSGLLFWRLEGLRMRTRFFSGWLAGLGCFVPGLYWAHSFNTYGAAALMAIEALSMAVAAALVPRNLLRGPAFVGAFTILEAIRMTWPFGGLPIGGVFLGQADGPLLRTARIGGPLLLTALVWGSGAVLATLVVGLLRSPHKRPTNPVLVSLVGVVAVVVAGYLAPNGGPPVGRLSVASIQGGGKRGFDKEQVNPATVFAAQLAATYEMERKDAHHTPRLVLWPEDVISLAGPLQGSSEGATMAQLASGLHTTIIAGVTSTVSSTAFDNMAVVWAPNGHVVAHYEKVHRVPFGEYVPYRGFFSHFANLSRVPLDAVPGHGSGMVNTPVGKVGIMISYEVFFANRSLPAVRAGAQLLLVPTNTSSYAASQIPTQEVAADEIQATEEGRDLVQAAPTGYSTVVNNNGQLLQRSVLGKRDVILATVAMRTGRTIYERFGDPPVLLACALALALSWIKARLARPA